MILDREAYNARRDSLSYPPIPDATEFLNRYGYEAPVKVRYWDWSTTFGQWGALVEFADGRVVFTYPKPEGGAQ
jgi:hypothetical protein